MKIRHGFVSNSSSTSFVIAFPERPTSIEIVKKMLFDEEEEWNYHSYRGNDKYSTYKIAETVFRDITNYNKNKVQLSKEAILCAKVNGDIYLIMEELYPDYKWGTDNYWNVHEALAYIQRDEYEEYNELKEEYPDSFIYTLSYSDEDGEFWSMMEHSGIFYNIPHRVVNHH